MDPNDSAAVAAFKSRVHHWPWEKIDYWTHSQKNQEFRYEKGVIIDDVISEVIDNIETAVCEHPNVNDRSDPTGILRVWIFHERCFGEMIYVKLEENGDRLVIMSAHRDD
jgi:hypothetical protein